MLKMLYKVYIRATKNKPKNVKVYKINKYVKYRKEQMF